MTSRVPGASQGSVGFIAVADEWDPGETDMTKAKGKFQAPTQTLLGENNTTLAATPDMVARTGYLGGRDSDFGHRTAKVKNTGPFTMGLYPTNGRILLQKALGKATPLTAIAPDTIAAITTADGMTQITLTTGSASWKFGRPFLISAAPNQEPSVVFSYDPVGKIISCPAVVLDHSVGDAITAPGDGVGGVSSGVISPWTALDGYPNALGTISFYEDVGGKWAWCYTDGYVGKWALAATAAKIDVTPDLSFSSMRVHPTSMLDFDDSDASLSELSYEFADGFLVFPADQYGTGTPAAQRVALSEDWGITIDNKLIAKPCYDGKKPYIYFPGNPREITVNFRFIEDMADHPVAWEDFFMQNLNVPYLNFLVQNTGDMATPHWQIQCYAIPNLRYLPVVERRAANDMVGEDIPGTALRVNGKEKMQVFYLNT